MSDQNKDFGKPLSDRNRGQGVSPAPQSAIQKSLGTLASGAGDTSMAPGQPAGGPGIAPVPLELGRYRILRPLGEGAMGVVYLAEDTQLKRQVALKVPQLGAERDGTRLERFYREARLAATLSHPNICQIHDVGEHEGTHFISMTYVRGKQLSAFLKPGKPRSERTAASLVRKIAMALQEAHLHGVIHRDLKPANIMVDQRGEPVVMDFGLARQFNSPADVQITHTGAILGTPAYMSPEQVAGKSAAVGAPADIYALGVILYQMLTGRLPFEGPVVSILAQIATQAAAPPSTHRPELNTQLEAICLKAMARDPVERYASMKDFAAALTEFLRAPKPAGRETDTSDKMFAELSQLKLETPTPIDRHMRHPDAGLIGQAKRYAASVKSLVELGRRLPVWGWLVIACSLVGIVLFAGFIRIPTPERLGSIGLSDSEAEIDEKAGRANEALVHQINVLEPRKDRDDNGLRLKLVHCPAGDILTGLFNDSSHDESKKPPLKVELNEFWLGKYEVTQAQWRQVMNTEPWEGHGDVRDGADHPVSYVDWYDASDFCREFTIQERAAGRLPEGWEYSLPTADQWEYACRAGTVTDFSFGNDEANLDDYAWFNGNTEGIGEGYAHPAGKKTANSWGLHDMHGNVWEWCRSENGTIPAVDRATADSNNENSRDVRGGSWRDASAYCRLTYRGRYNSRVKFSAVGFRVALIAKADRSIDAVAQVAAEVPENLDRKPLFRLGQWHVEGDALIKSGDGWGILQFGDPLWQDYDFSFEVVKTAGPYGAAGRFRFLDQKNYMEFDLGAGGNTIYGAATFVDRKGSFNRVKRNVSMEQDRKYRMLIKARKNHFTCYLDDEMIFDYEDDRLSHGPVGFVACQTSARFSSIRVTDPDGRVLWEGLPRVTDSGD